ncbi:Asp-tRNA(Asn)/Glu-tRNA(Gln) amidotransferase subunit GatB [Kosmotoga olearia]|uniref:Aspartyl/glutamyl-tRNA(Asn/Gln) amidotransferase subunit B n=1 Tax=Kosmotoga olearia (strain ATCC BAA-1733 / DSM 21960 / TBF 19.5.1) TaxID=521045 RepID=C5CDG6_KOSOT|nr:Asp-tRNA(Asn)/Glu-tRNA(Gln) amidotransferase subunit GatB [Kosmotoga olearia]ACR79050.1 glutamyl-tRNA(Gln) amidotransferase, B subunit [Kosmotoga olearia TBF 19.5.1]
MYKAVIGLEIHAQLSTVTKAFCNCSADVFELEPNTAICPVCTGQPGSLPVLNEKVVEYALKAALAFNCEINLFSSFDRKNYFYPDLPKGYQITQYFHPIAEHGYLMIGTGESRKKVRIRRIHIEEDAGKMLHQGADSISGATESFVDLNRCGVPLIEIVTEPDLNSPKEAREFMELLRDTLRYIEVCSGDMEKGALRCDANISVYDTETGKSSERVEVKNINSFKFVEKALEFEFERIKAALENGENIVRETRSWNFSARETTSMRSKEEENDYRYFPEPDLPELKLTQEYVDKVKKELPELPWEKQSRFVQEYGIPEYDASVLCSDKELANFFEDVARATGKPKETSNWIMTEFLRELKQRNASVDQLGIKPEHFVDLFKLLDSGKISTKIAKELFSKMVENKKMPSELVEELGLQQINDEKLIEELIRKAMEANPKAVKQYRSGKKGVAGYFVGIVMKGTKGKANPALVNEIVRRLLEE